MRVTFSLFILVVAIQSYAGSSIDSLKAKLDGRWEWLGITDGWGGMKYTPQSVGYSLTMVFDKNKPQQESDSIGYQVYRNDSLLLSGTALIFNKKTICIPAFGPNNEIIPYTKTLSIDNDNNGLIFIDTAFVDVPVIKFARSKTSLRRDPFLVRATVSSSPHIRLLKQYTLSGQKINTRLRSALPAQIVVFRQYAIVKGINKR